jgi:hypothetical protein
VRTAAQIAEISMRAKAWYTKAQQGVAIILQTHLPADSSAIEDLRSCCLAISAIDFIGLTAYQSNQLADYLIDNGWQTEVDQGKRYVQDGYTVLNQYVVFNQN